MGRFEGRILEPFFITDLRSTSQIDICLRFYRGIHYIINVRWKTALYGIGELETERNSCNTINTVARKVDLKMGRKIANCRVKKLTIAID